MIGILDVAAYSAPTKVVFQPKVRRPEGVSPFSLVGQVAGKSKTLLSNKNE